MSRYRGPHFKKIRHLGVLPGLTKKRPKGGSDLRNQSRFGKKSQYRLRLKEKQKLRCHYGLTEQQLIKYVHIAGKSKGSTARQLVNHRHILVNGHIVDIPSYRSKPPDIIMAKDEQKSKTLIQNSLNSSPHEEVPNHLTLQPFQYKGLVNQIIDSKWVGLKVNELLVVEYYSSQT
ncbi:Ribosomal protein S4 [Handroanthus impetiginosus]|uniref:Small ribosomal subunit protein uS4c n=1 Tax=Handroanthus impetiginosus TaxID=429701 RepID=A0A2G9G6U8_9LAMI|nr:Ribosomal protein S4 [Handroanthus impetiginosus]